MEYVQLEALKKKLKTLRNFVILDNMHFKQKFTISVMETM